MSLHGAPKMLALPADRFLALGFELGSRGGHGVAHVTAPRIPSAGRESVKNPPAHPHHRQIDARESSRISDGRAVFGFRSVMLRERNGERKRSRRDAPRGEARLGAVIGDLGDRCGRSSERKIDAIARERTDGTDRSGWGSSNQPRPMRRGERSRWIDRQPVREIKHARRTGGQDGDRGGCRTGWARCQRLKSEKANSTGHPPVPALGRTPSDRPQRGTAG